MDRGYIAGHVRRWPRALDKLPEVLAGSQPDRDCVAGVAPAVVRHRADEHEDARRFRHSVAPRRRLAQQAPCEALHGVVHVAEGAGTGRERRPGCAHEALRRARGARGAGRGGLSCSYRLPVRSGCYTADHAPPLSPAGWDKIAPFYISRYRSICFSLVLYLCIYQSIDVCLPHPVTRRQLAT